MAPLVCGLSYSFLIFVFVTATDNPKADGLGKGAHSERGGLWFGPRLGKRSLQMRSERNSDTMRKLIEAADTLKFYYDQMPYELQADPLTKAVSKKVIFTPKLGRALDYDSRGVETLDFTPRLGRKLGEELRTDDEPEQVMDARANLFSPRLGRSFKFSPRLGRELSDYLYLEPEVRVARSSDKS
ncbi:PBAN-type neuropeptides-like [Aricia agestis]|uniref:PBAN-type neuropeptides-like n=1 Tax=Aricia agestis TaxID=91739 RepID=UPI001C2035C5|nr:PBAN-type neuropeptides-like [Aricia agestis]